MPSDAGTAFEFTDDVMSGLALSPDGALILYVCTSEILIADLASGDIVFRRSRPEADYFGPVWSPRGDKVAVCQGQTASVRIMNRHGATISTILHGARPDAAAFSPDGTLLAIVGGQQLQLCRSDDGREVVRLSLPTRPKSVAFSHSGATLACGDELGKVTLFGVAEMRPLGELACASTVDCLAFSPDDALLATGHGDAIIRLWHVDARRLRAELVGDERFISDIAFSPDGRSLLTAGTDGSVRLWSADHGRSYGTVYRRFETGNRDASCHMSLSSDGRRLAIGYSTQRVDCPDVFLWRIDPTE
jgi:WD40 repeat protein